MDKKAEDYMSYLDKKLCCVKKHEALHFLAQEMKAAVVLYTQGMMGSGDTLPQAMASMTVIRWALQKVCILNEAIRQFTDEELTSSAVVLRQLESAMEDDEHDLPTLRS